MFTISTKWLPNFKFFLGKKKKKKTKGSGIKHHKDKIQSFSRFICNQITKRLKTNKTPTCDLSSMGDNGDNQCRWKTIRKNQSMKTGEDWEEQIKHRLGDMNNNKEVGMRLGWLREGIWKDGSS